MIGLLPIWPITGIGWPWLFGGVATQQRNTRPQPALIRALSGWIMRGRQ